MVARLERYGFGSLYINRKGYQDDCKGLISELVSEGKPIIAESKMGDLIAFKLFPQKDTISPNEPEKVTWKNDGRKRYLSFIDEFDKMVPRNVFNKTILHGKSLFAHPSNNPSSLFFPDIRVLPSSSLYFGIDLKATHNGVRYEIIIDDSVLYSEVFFRPVDTYRIVDIGKYANRNINIEFRVDPLGDYNSDLAYWVEPHIFSSK